jgi:hypothetical protein
MTSRPAVVCNWKYQYTVRVLHQIKYIEIICDNVDRIKQSAKSGNEVFILLDYHSPVGKNFTKNYGCTLHFYCIINK